MRCSSSALECRPALRYCVWVSMDAVSSHVAQKLSDKILDYLGTVGDGVLRRDANLRDLQDYIKRLDPLIVQYMQIWDTSAISLDAREWLQRVRKEYEEVERLLQPSRGFVQLLQSSASVKEVNNNLSKLLEDAKGLQQASGSQTDEERRKKGWDSSKPDITFGGQAVLDKLTSTLLGWRPQWIMMSGMGGVGKTHTAREAFHDERIRSHFSGGQYWVTVSKDKPKTHAILQSLSAQISHEENVNAFPRDAKEAVARVKDKLHGRRNVFIVFDDVWDPDDVECFDGIMENGQGVILVTTRDEGNARWVADVAEFIDVPVLSEDDSWKLFKTHAFPTRPNHDEPPELHIVARDVAKECKGLPLALRVIGATMRGVQVVPKERRSGKRTLRSEWDKFLVKLQNAQCHEDKYKELFRKLQLSIDSLIEEDRRLFHCFCYFAAYLEDSRIYGFDLVKLWFAEDLGSREDRSWSSYREDVPVLLDTLVRKSMIESTEQDVYFIHDVLRDLARHNLEWDFLAQRELSTANRECLYAPGLMSPDFPREWTLGSSLWELFKEWISPGSSNGLRAERLSLHGSSVSRLSSKFNAPRLRMLLLAQSENLRALPSGFFQSLSSLTVLDLSWTNVEEISAGVLRGLIKLRVLDLSFCDQLKRISNEIINLQRLETLLLIDCDELENLPPVGKLKSLRYFVAQVATRFDLVCDDFNGWQRWSDYFMFRGLARYALLELFRSDSLKVLELSAETEEEYDTALPDVSSLSALEVMTITHLLFPTGIVNLQNLKVLEVYFTIPTGDYQIPALDELSRLEELELRLHTSIVTELPPSFGSAGAFPSLKRIFLHCNGLTRMFRFCDGTMPKVESVTWILPELEELPKSLGNLHSLKVLKVGDCSKAVVRGMVELVQERVYFVSLQKLSISVQDGIEKDCRDTLLDLNLDYLPNLRVFEGNFWQYGRPSHVEDLVRQRGLEVRYSGVKI